MSERTEFASTDKLKRGLTWSVGETKTLLSIWGESHVQEELDSATRNSHVFKNIATKLSEMSGYDRTPQECRQRVKTLKKGYFSTKTRNKTSGQGRVTCRYYEELDEILGGRPAVSPPKVTDSSRHSVNQLTLTNDVEYDDLEDSNSLDIICDPPSTVPVTVDMETDCESERPSDSSLPNLIYKPRAERKSKAGKTTKDSTSNHDNKKSVSGKLRKADESLLLILKEQQKEFLESEAKRWEEEKRHEEKMRKEERDHEMRLFSMFAGIVTGHSRSNSNTQHNTCTTNTTNSSFSYQHQPCQPDLNNMSFLRMLNDDFFQQN